MIPEPTQDDLAIDLEAAYERATVAVPGPKWRGDADPVQAALIRRLAAAEARLASTVEDRDPLQLIVDSEPAK